jgi:hypothetical protein
MTRTSAAYTGSPTMMLNGNVIPPLQRAQPARGIDAPVEQEERQHAREDLVGEREQRLLAALAGHDADGQAAEDEEHRRTPPVRPGRRRGWAG